MSNASLNSAIKVKNDEFFTRLEDIENELQYYKSHFYQKTVVCNCDNYRNSNFFKYFILHFNKLKLQRLITTGLEKGKSFASFVGYVPTIKEGQKIDSSFINQLFSVSGNTIKELHSDGMYPAGDFRSYECKELMKEADIVVTNPPFSLFRDFIAQVIAFDKKFLVIGNKNAITYKTIFPLIKNNKLWLGCNPVKTFWENGNSIRKFGNVGWYTNLPVTKKSDIFIFTEHYYDNNGNPLPDVNIRYPKYDNYEAINIDKLKNVPCDYFGVMGVPITFVEKYNPSVIVEGGQKINDFFTLLGQPNPKEKDLVKDFGQEQLPNPLLTEQNDIKEFLSNGSKNYPYKEEKNIISSPWDVRETLSGSLGQLFEIVGVINHGCDHEWDLCKCVVNGKEIFKRIAIRRK